jgi:hypothetical protein
VVDFPPKVVEEYMYRLNMSTSIMVAVPATRYFSGSFSKKKMDMKAEKVFWSVNNLAEGEIPTQTTMRISLGHEVGIRYFLQALFYDVSFSRVLKMGVSKTKLLYAPTGEEFNV